MRCGCGVYLKGSQRRCAHCAVEFARSLDTDRLLKEDLPDPNESGIRKWPALVEWEAQQIRKQRIKLVIGIVVIVALVGALMIGMARLGH